jgi:hypothetical protein
MNHEPSTTGREARVTILTRSRNSVVSPRRSIGHSHRYLRDPLCQRPAYGTIRFRDENGLAPENKKTALWPEKPAQKNGLSELEDLEERAKPGY